MQPPNLSTPASLRIFAAGLLVVGSIVLALPLAAAEPARTAWIVGLTIAAAGIVGIIYPSSVRPIHRALLWVTWPLRIAIAVVGLAIIYFLILWPTAWFARKRVRREWMLDYIHESTWKPSVPRKPEDYLRPY